MNEILRSDESDTRKGTYLQEKFGIQSSSGRRKVKKVVDLIRRFQKGTQEGNGQFIHCSVKE